MQYIQTNGIFLLIVILSSRIVRPISETYDKQRRFITDAGHELKTPITIIEAGTEILELDFGENEWVNDIRQQARRLSNLTADLIFLSRMEEPENRTMIDFPLSDVVGETVDSFQALAVTQNKNLIRNIEPMLSLYGDEKGIRQLISILLDNALKYSSEEGAIRMSLKKQNHSIHLVVENAVDEISDETVKNMFERFYRGDPARSSNKKGYGIGLSVAKAVVEVHKGKISASSITMPEIT